MDALYNAVMKKSQQHFGVPYDLALVSDKVEVVAKTSSSFRWCFGVLTCEYHSDEGCSGENFHACVSLIVLWSRERERIKELEYSSRRKTKTSTSRSPSDAGGGGV